MLTKEIKLPISKMIDTKFRDYAVYVLESRGIPSFYDALTPVQRYILMNSPTSFGKTLSVVGKSIEEGYHHGNASIEGSISKLARPFGSSSQLLEGYGFFGSEVCPEPAAPRYTSVKISTFANNFIRKYKHLNTKQEEGPYDPFWLDIPIGLTTSIVGIAVGYKTTILPRKLLDIQKYLEGKIKTIKPHFVNFNGSIKKYKGLNNSWLISSNITIVGNKIEIREIPPIMRYSSILKRLDAIFEEYSDSIRIVNNSNTKVNIDIIYRNLKKDDWLEIQTKIKKIFSIVVTENPVFVKDGQVLVYANVEEYLDDYKWQQKRLAYTQAKYELDYNNNELEFNIVKKKFIEFILQRKRTVQEVNTFLSDYNNIVKDRLERMTSKKFTKDELRLTTQEISNLKKIIIQKNKLVSKTKIIFDKNIDPTIKKGVSSKKNNINLFDTEDIEEVDGMIIWNGEDVFD